MLIFDADLKTAIQHAFDHNDLNKILDNYYNNLVGANRIKLDNKIKKK